MKEINDAFAELLAAINPREAPITREESVQTGIWRLSSGFEALRDWDVRRIDSCLSRLGDGIRVEVDEEPFGSDRRLPLDWRQTASASLLDYVSSADGASMFAVRVLLSKEKLLRVRFPASPNAIFWFLDEDAACKAIAEGLSAVERTFFRARTRTVMIVNGLPCSYRNPYFRLLPGDTPLQDVADEVNEAAVPALWELVETRIANRRTETNWQGAPICLAPDNLHLVPTAEVTEGQCRLAETLHKLCVDCVLASLANYTESVAAPSGATGSWLCRFDGQKRIEIATDKVASVSQAHGDQCFQLYEWAYASQHPTDTINIIRNILTLQPLDQATGNYGVILNGVTDIMNSSRSHYERYVGESIEKYFAKLKESATFFQSKVDSLGSQITGLTDTFVKNLLAVAGFVIGTVVAKVADPSAVTAVPILLWSFAAYVAITSTVYYTVSWKTYKLTKAEYEKSQENAVKFFTPEDIQRYIGDSFIRRSHLFRWTFWATTGLYVLIVLVALGLAVLQTSRANSVAQSKAMAQPPAPPVAKGISPSSPAPKKTSLKIPSSPSAKAHSQSSAVPKH